MLSERPRILLAEDDPITQEVIATHLAVIGCDVVRVDCAREAINAFRAQCFQAVILDCHLGEDLALDLFHRLLELPEFVQRSPPVLAISAELDDQRIESLLDAGFSDAMEKPVSANRLRDALRLCGIELAAAAEVQQTSFDQPAVNPVLDDARGLESCGSMDVLSGLRRLLLTELPCYLEELDAAIKTQDLAALRDVLHRMKSALAFCGAMELLAQISACNPVTVPDDAQQARWQVSAQALRLVLGEQLRRA